MVMSKALDVALILLETAAITLAIATLAFNGNSSESFKFKCCTSSGCTGVAAGTYECQLSCRVLSQCTLNDTKCDSTCWSPFLDGSSGGYICGSSCSRTLLAGGVILITLTIITGLLVILDLFGFFVGHVGNNQYVAFVLFQSTGTLTLKLTVWMVSLIAAAMILNGATVSNTASCALAHILVDISVIIPHMCKLYWACKSTATFPTFSRLK